MEKKNVLNTQSGFWSGPDGSKYTTQQNSMDHTKNFKYRYESRKAFFDLFDEYDRDVTILEAGCGGGVNLKILHDTMGFKNLTGIDICKTAISEAEERLDLATYCCGDMASMPFEDGQFDIVFTSGVLVNVHPTQSLPIIMNEMYRCAKKAIIGREDYNNAIVAGKWRGRHDLYWKAPYADLWLKNVKGLTAGFNSIHTVEGAPRQVYIFKKSDGIKS